MPEQTHIDIECLTNGPGAHEQPVSPVETIVPSQDGPCTTPNLESSEVPQLRSCRSDGVLRGRTSVHKGTLTIRSRSLERGDSGGGAATDDNLDKSVVVTRAPQSVNSSEHEGGPTPVPTRPRLVTRLPRPQENRTPETDKGLYRPCASCVLYEVVCIPVGNRCQVCDTLRRKCVPDTSRSSILLRQTRKNLLAKAAEFEARLAELEALQSMLKANNAKLETLLSMLEANTAHPEASVSMSEDSVDQLLAQVED